MTDPRAWPEEREWRAEVERGLAGAPFDSLTATTLDGARLAPLYTERDRPAEEGIPWLPRSPRALGAVRDASVLAAMDDERRAGATLVWVRDDGLRIAEMRPQPCEGLEILLEPRGDQHHVLAVAARGVRVAIDPLGGGDLEGLADAIAGALGRGAPVLGARGTLVPDSPVRASDEIAIATASLVASLRALEARSVPLERAVSLATIALEVGTDFFSEIAKLRALRRILARALDAAGIAERPLVAARTSPRTLSALDQPTNVLRSTLGASAALIGGADAIGVLAHDALREASAQGARLARSTPLVLALESHLGAPADPARGSYYVEHLTAVLARDAWALLREIEAAGGLPGARARLEPRLAAYAAARASAVATRRASLVGASRFPTAEAISAPADHHRDAVPFEQLRARGRGVSACVIAAPGCPEPRVEFARELAMIACTDVSVARAPSEPAAALGDASIVILAAADRDLAAFAPAAARALRDAGARAIAVAGKPGAHEATLRDAGIDAFAYLGADVVAVLGALLDRVEAAR